MTGVEIRIIDKAGEIAGSVEQSREEILEALGFGELYRELREVERWEPAKAIAILAKRGYTPSPQGDGSWLAYLGYNAAVRLRKEGGYWIAEFALPIKYDEGTFLILERMRALRGRVERLEHALKTLADAVQRMEERLSEREEEKKGRIAERLADALERLAEILEAE